MGREKYRDVKEQLMIQVYHITCGHVLVFTDDATTDVCNI